MARRPAKKDRLRSRRPPTTPVRRGSGTASSIPSLPPGVVCRFCVATGWEKHAGSGMNLGLSSRRSRVRFSSGAFRSLPSLAGIWLPARESTVSAAAGRPRPAARFQASPTARGYILATSRVWSGSICLAPYPSDRLMVQAGAPRPLRDILRRRCRIWCCLRAGLRLLPSDAGDQVDALRLASSIKSAPR
jgi:hypothetical protein